MIGCESDSCAFMEPVDRGFDTHFVGGTVGHLSAGQHQAPTPEYWSLKSCVACEVVECDTALLCSVWRNEGSLDHQQDAACQWLAQFGYLFTLLDPVCCVGMCLDRLGCLSMSIANRADVMSTLQLAVMIVVAQGVLRHECLNESGFVGKHA